MVDITFYDDKDIQTIDSIGKYLRHIKDFENSYSGEIYFRGQNNQSYSLKPTAGRSDFYKHNGKSMAPLTFEQERNLLHRFKRYAYNHVQKILNDWEALFLARHHGLPVRLLDWTSNPLVALYHAAICEEKPSNDGAVWVIHRIKDSNVINVLTETRSPLEIPGVRIIYPVYISPRLIAQSGCFTLHQHPESSLEEDSPNNYNTGEFDILILRKWKVPCNKKVELIDQLERMAINNRTLFPDLDGLAKGLWQLEVIRKH